MAHQVRRDVFARGAPLRRIDLQRGERLGNESSSRHEVEGDEGLSVLASRRGIRCFNVDPGFVVTDAMRARGGAEDIEAQGFDLAPEDAAGRVIAWLASDPAADSFLGKVIWSPLLAAKL